MGYTHHPLSRWTMENAKNSLALSSIFFSLHNPQQKVENKMDLSKRKQILFLLFLYITSPIFFGIKK
jgi:hypothetical protein